MATLSETKTTPNFDLLTERNKESILRDLPEEEVTRLLSLARLPEETKDRLKQKLEIRQLQRDLNYGTDGLWFGKYTFGKFYSNYVYIEAITSQTKEEALQIVKILDDTYQSSYDHIRGFVQGRRSAGVKCLALNYNQYAPENVILFGDDSENEWLNVYKCSNEP
jgi:hypothetical protein